MMAAARQENYRIWTSLTQDQGELLVGIHNDNPFRLLDLDVEILRSGSAAHAAEYHIGNIPANSCWLEGQESTAYSSFQKISLYEGKEQAVHPALYNAEQGIYFGSPHHALVWPETDTEAEWERELQFEHTEAGIRIRICFTALGPRIAFCGHSFTGLWDSSYYYFRELAKMGGWNAQIAYSYWGETGIAGYAGLVKGQEERAEQCSRLLSGNDAYDFFVTAGNSDEAVETCSKAVGAVDYRQRERMLRGAHILREKAAEKEARMILWTPHAYRYGFLEDMNVKPWEAGRIGDVYEKNGRQYILTMTAETMTLRNENWYRNMAEELGGDVLTAPVSLAYHKVFTAYGEKVNPYLKMGTECGDHGHQNNVGNYIAACVLYCLIFQESPAGLGVPASHTWGMGGGKVSAEQASLIQKKVEELFF